MANVVGNPALTGLLLAGLTLLSVGQPSRGAPGEPLPSSGGKVFSAYFSQLTRERRAVGGLRSGGSAAADPVEVLTPDDVFLAVKSTGRFHQPRLELLLDTWISRNMQQTFVFTDTEDEELRKRMGKHLINTHCSSAHNRQALSCKMSREFDAFVESGKKWFCHLDDDNYMNTGALRRLLAQYRHTQDVYLGRPSLERPIDAAAMLGAAETKRVKFWFATGGAGFCLSRGLALKMQPWASDDSFMATSEHIRLPDDCTVGYIVEALLGVHMTRSPLFHSHLENLALVSDVHSQVTMSYGSLENGRNTVNLRGPFSSSQDPTRFRSIHCVLYPDTSWCPRQLEPPL